MYYLCKIDRKCIENTSRSFDLQQLLTNLTECVHSQLRDNDFAGTVDRQKNRLCTTD